MKVSLCQSEIVSKSNSFSGHLEVQIKLFISPELKILGTLPKDGFNPQRVIDAMAGVYTSHAISYTVSY